MLESVLRLFSYRQVLLWALFLLLKAGDHLGIVAGALQPLRAVCFHVFRPRRPHGRGALQLPPTRHARGSQRLCFNQSLPISVFLWTKNLARSRFLQPEIAHKTPDELAFLFLPNTISERLERVEKFCRSLDGCVVREHFKQVPAHSS